MIKNPCKSRPQHFLFFFDSELENERFVFEEKVKNVNPTGLTLLRLGFLENRVTEGGSF